MTRMKNPHDPSNGRIPMHPDWTPTVCDADKEMMFRIERYILAYPYHGNDLLHDIELNFPGASYRAFFLAYGRTRDPARWLDPDGQA